MIDTVRLSPSRYRAMPKRHHSSGLGILRAPARRLISGYTGEATKMFESAASDALGKLNLRCHRKTAVSVSEIQLLDEGLPLSRKRR
jgi:hypothetical protein